MTREETHKKLLELRDRATRQPISYKPLFVEAVDIAANLLQEICVGDAEIAKMGAWVEQNYQLDRYGVALMMIREGCSDPAGLARRILSEFE